MALFILAICLVITFFYKEKVFIYALILFFVFFDMLDGFYKDDKIFAAIRYIIPLSLLLFYIIKHKALKESDTVLFILISYLLFLWMVNAGDMITTSRNVMAVLITLLMIPVGKQLVKTTDFLKEFENYNRVLLFALPAYIILANRYGIGESYTEAFSTGFLVTSRIYIIPVVVFLAVHYIITHKERNWTIKTVDGLLILINLCILLINTRRTALGMLLAALVVYAFFNRRAFFKMISLLFLLVMALIFTYPLYEARLTAQLEKRERIQNLDTYEEEGRYLETLYIINYHQKKESLVEIFFGVQLFDTKQFGLRYFGHERPIHSDLNMIFYSTGVVGLLLFCSFLFHYFFRNNQLLHKEHKAVFYSFLIMFLVVLLPGRFIGTLTFAPFLMLLLTTLKFRNPLLFPAYEPAQLSATEEQPAAVAYP